MQKPYSVIVAGTTSKTLMAAQALQNDSRFEISAVITPSPKPTGRKQVLTLNPVQEWAEKNNSPAILVETKIDESVKTQLEKLPQPDFLLVVDFGYLVPQWLINLPKIAPINIHPSALPKWRGSSPGQFSILFGEKTSAVSIMILGKKMDQGPVIKQIPFETADSWTQKDYYDYSFKLAAEILADTLDNLAEGKISPVNQPEDSETPSARRLSKSDSFIPFEIIERLMAGQKPNSKDLPMILQNALPYHGNNINHLLAAASKAFSGWPELWTEIPTKKGNKRMKLLELGIQDNKLQLKKVHISGHEKPASWNQVKTTLLTQ